MIEQIEKAADNSLNILSTSRALAAVALSTICFAEAVNTPQAFAANEPYYEYIQPAGKMRGVALIIHGGAWGMSGPETVNNPIIRREASVVRSAGFASMNIDYRNGLDGFQDITTFYHKARTIAGSRPVCAVGTSAGGYWALELALKRKIDCVITQGAPTDLTSLEGPVYAAAIKTFADGVASPEAVNSELWKWSPLRNANQLPPSLISNAQNDEVVDSDQGRALKGIANIDVQILEPGTAHFTHSPVTQAGLKKFRLKERNLLLRAASMNRARRPIRSSR